MIVPSVVWLSCVLSHSALKVPEPCSLTLAIHLYLHTSHIIHSKHNACLLITLTTTLSDEDSADVPSLSESSFLLQHFLIFLPFLFLVHASFPFQEMLTDGRIFSRWWCPVSFFPPPHSRMALDVVIKLLCHLSCATFCLTLSCSFLLASFSAVWDRLSSVLWFTTCIPAKLALAGPFRLGGLPCCFFNLLFLWALDLRSLCSPLMEPAFCLILVGFCPSMYSLKLSLRAAASSATVTSASPFAPCRLSLLHTPMLLLLAAAYLAVITTMSVTCITPRCCYCRDLTPEAQARKQF